MIPSCSEAGILGVLPGMIGCIQVSEAIKVILGIGNPLSGKLLIYDSLESNQRLLTFEGSNGEQVEESDTVGDEMMFKSIDANSAIAKMKDGWSPMFVDVRSEIEWQQARISSEQYLCPHDEILSAVSRIPKDKDILVHCRSGMRSQLAIVQLLQAGYDGNRMYNLDGGIIQWAESDPEAIIQG